MNQLIKRHRVRSLIKIWVLFKRPKHFSVVHADGRKSRQNRIRLVLMSICTVVHYQNDNASEFMDSVQNFFNIKNYLQKV